MSSSKQIIFLCNAYMKVQVNQNFVKCSVTVIPASQGWICDVVFGGRNSIFRFFRPSKEPSVCAVQLSTINSDFWDTLLSNHFNHSFHISIVIQAFVLLEYRTGNVAILTLLKQRGFRGLINSCGLIYVV